MQWKQWLLALAFISFLLVSVILFLNLGLKNQPPIKLRDQQISKPTQGFPIPKESSWTLLLTGDVIPARVTNQKMVATGDFMWPFRQVAHMLKDADITLINLEAPLLSICPVTNEGFTFCGDRRFAQSLQTVGVDVVSLANNHTLNYGWEGFGETEEHLKAVGIETTGFTYALSVIPTSSAIPTPSVIPDLIRDPVNGKVKPMLDSRFRGNDNLLVCEKDMYCSKFITKTVQGVTVGFLGYNAVGQSINRVRVTQEIKTADQLVDVLIVSVHWGKEYTRVPETDGIAQDDPKELGKLFIGAGADLVVGNHPHWYQGIEWYLGKPIFYALGNFIFDQEWSPETKLGYLAKLTFTGTQITKDAIEIFPIGIRDFGQAYLLDGEEAKEVRDFLSLD